MADNWYFTNTGEKWMLEYGVAGKASQAAHNMKVGMYTNEDFGESNALTMSQITEPTGTEWSGYAQQTLLATTWDAPTISGNKGQIRYGAKTRFEMADDDTGTGCKVYGAFLADAAGTTLIAIYALPQVADMKPNDDEYQDEILLRLKLTQGTA